MQGLTWTLPAALGVTITAAQLDHRVPCWGYVLHEHDPPLRPQLARLAKHGLTAVRCTYSKSGFIRGSAQPTIPAKAVLRETS